MRPDVKNIVGKSFGRITVLSYEDNSKRGAYFKCICTCGKVKTIRGRELRNGRIESCGCLQKEKVTTHGLSYHPLYGTWADMVARCYDKNNLAFKWYGALGITVCENWRADPQTFFDDVGDRPDGMTIDRIDGTKGYFKENCKWATQKDQQNNRRNNTWYKYKGLAYNCKQLCGLFGLKAGNIRARMYRGKSPSQAFGHNVERITYEESRILIVN